MVNKNITPEILVVILDRIKDTGRYALACHEQQVSPTAFKKLTEENEELADALRDAEAIYSDKVHQELITRALSGRQQELHYKGEKTGDTVTVWSDALLLAEAKRVMADFTERKEVNVKGGGGVLAIPVNPAGVNWEQVLNDSEPDTSSDLSSESESK